MLETRSRHVVSLFDAQDHIPISQDSLGMSVIRQGLGDFSSFQCLFMPGSPEIRGETKFVFTLLEKCLICCGLFQAFTNSLEPLF